MPKVHEGVNEALRTFADTLYQTAFPVTRVKVEEGRETQSISTSLTKLSDDRKLIYSKGQELHSPDDKRIVTVLSNCLYARSFLLEETEEKFIECFYSSLDTSDVKELYLDLESILTTRYIRNKTIGLDSIIQSGIMFSGIDWTNGDYQNGINQNDSYNRSGHVRL